MWFQHLLPSLSSEFSEKMILNSALDPVLHLVAESTKLEYEQTIYPYIKPIFKMAKTNQVCNQPIKYDPNIVESTCFSFAFFCDIQATISLLENIEIFAEKSTEDDFKHELLPIVTNAFDSKNPDIQVKIFFIFLISSFISICIVYSINFIDTIN